VRPTPPASDLVLIPGSDLVLRSGTKFVRLAQQAATRTSSDAISAVQSVAPQTSISTSPFLVSASLPATPPTKYHISDKRDTDLDFGIKWETVVPAGSVLVYRKTEKRLDYEINTTQHENFGDLHFVSGAVMNAIFPSKTK